MRYSAVKYENIDNLDARIERIIKKTVKHYYTDWKNYDRPKYMRFKGSLDPKDKKFYILARETGTYVIRACDIGKDDWATTLYEYFHTQEHSDYYFVDLNKLSIRKIDPEADGLIS